MTQLAIDRVSIQTIKNIDSLHIKILITHCDHLWQGHGDNRVCVLSKGSICHPDESSVSWK